MKNFHFRFNILLYCDLQTYEAFQMTPSHQTKDKNYTELELNSHVMFQKM